MITTELSNYIKTEIKKGTSKDVIMANLVKAGWLASDIQEGFQTVEQAEAANQPPPVAPIHKYETMPGSPFATPAAEPIKIKDVVKPWFKISFISIAIDAAIIIATLGLVYVFAEPINSFIASLVNKYNPPAVSVAPTNNNTAATASLTVGNISTTDADLVVTAISISPLPPKVNSEQTMVIVEIKNQGKDPSDPKGFSVSGQLSDSGRPAIEGQIAASIKSGDSTVWTFYLYPPLGNSTTTANIKPDAAGMKSLTITVNGDKAIQETDYMNNATSTNFNFVE